MTIATSLAYPVEASYDEAASESLMKRTRKDLKELVSYDRWNEQEPA